MHGSKEAWKALEEGLHPSAAAVADDADPVALATLFGVPPEHIRAALANGWRPPKLAVRR